MTNALQKLSPQQRRVLFFVVMAVTVVVVLAISWLVLVALVRSSPRLVPIVLTEGWQVREYVQLNDADAYPATLAIAPDGTLYSGSYVTGALWAIAPDGTQRELPDTRAQIGSVTAITVAPDGRLFVLDRLSPFQALGMKIWLLEGDTLTLFADYRGSRQETLLLPDDLAVDSAGNVYVSDRGRDFVWRIDPDGGGGTVWWRNPPIANVQNYAPTGLAYDPARHALFISDSALDILYQVDIGEDGSAVNTRVLYTRQMSDEPIAIGFDGLSVLGDTLYVAGLNNGRVGAFDLNTRRMTYLAGNFRGAVDVSAAQDGRVFVANWDQRSLLPVPVLLFEVTIEPHLPFSLDVLTRAD